MSQVQKLEFILNQQICMWNIIYCSYLIHLLQLTYKPNISSDLESKEKGRTNKIHDDKIPGANTLTIPDI